MATKKDGVYRLPGQQGKLLRVSKVLDGTHKVYWGFTQQSMGFNTPVVSLQINNNVYRNPTRWFVANDPVVMPRNVRWSPGITTISGVPHWSTTYAPQVKSFIESNFKYVYLSSQNNSSFPFLQTLVALPADIASSSYIGTDVFHMHFIDPQSGDYWGLPGQPTGTYTADIANLLAGIPQMPGWKLYVQLIDVRPLAPPPALPVLNIIHNNAVAFFSSTLASALGPTNYQYGGVFVQSSPSAAPPLQNYIDLIVDHFDLD